MLQVSGSLVDVKAHWGGCRGRRARFEVDGSFSEQHHVLERAEAGVPGRPALLQEPCGFGGSRISQTPFFKRKAWRFASSRNRCFKTRRKCFEAVVVLAGRARLGLAGGCCWHGACRSTVPAGLAFCEACDLCPLQQIAEWPRIALPGCWARDVGVYGANPILVNMIAEGRDGSDGGQGDWFLLSCLLAI